ncbi:MAG: metalloregulator ArsR/SmtB family transcription factor [Acidobacteria bacterium]|nr:metalloregulator ArsR/SmtB family transcription factor [Acidobacteriota bacterium]
MIDTAGLLRVLADPARLRLLRALAREPLNVTELTAVLAMAQSGVSRHLGLLRKLGVVVEERRGTFAWYRLAPDVAGQAGPRAALWSWLHGEFEHATDETRSDDSRLEEVRRLRKENFLQHGGGSERRQFVPGRSWAAWARALSLLLPAADVADLGCGEGYLTVETARWATRVTAIDRSADVLARARALAARRGVDNITWKRGELERLPLGDASVDVAILSQALHHADDPAAALAEAWRVLRPGGRVLILDLREHDQTWVRSKLGDRWLGFTDESLRRLLAASGFHQPVVRVGARRTADPFTVLVASAIKPSAAARTSSRRPRTVSAPRRRAPRTTQGAADVSLSNERPRR